RVVDENVPQALAGWRPTVTIAGSAGYNQGTIRSRGIYSDSDRPIGSAQATISQPLFNGGRTVAGTRRAENQVMAQRARLLAAEQQVLSDTVSAYVAVIRDQE